MSSRIEQIIGEIEEYVDSCKFQPLSTTKIVVNKEEIEELPENVDVVEIRELMVPGLKEQRHLIVIRLKGE